MNKNKYLLLIILLIIPFAFHAQTNKASRYTAKSVLSEGNWYKIKVASTGIYKLTYNDLKNIGLSNPGKVKVHGYGGWMLDEDFTKTYVDDLPQVAIWMSNTPDKFGASDYILFYARGDIKWEYNESKKIFEHTQNPYSTDSYYFVTESDGETNIMGNASLEDAGTTSVTTFPDYFLYEKELFTVAESGRELYGESFATNKSQNFTVSLPGITADPAILDIYFIARTKDGSLSLTMNNSLLQTYSIDKISDSDSYTKAHYLNKSLQVTNAIENNVFNLKYNSQNTDQNVHLNYFRITYTKALKPYGAVTLFRSALKNEHLQYKISEASSTIRVFDVTDAISPSYVDAKLSGTELSFTASNTSIREYAMVDLSKSIPTPTSVGKIKNQNLHGLEAKDMVIIVQSSLADYAQQLKEIHENNDGLQSLIVDPEDIYNEFSSGKPDASAYRRFLKMFYDRAATDSEKPKYLLLFGDGTYDNRFLITQNSWTASDKRSMLLTYQTINSLDETWSFTTDDYFGLLDDDDKPETAYGIDLGIGRLPVRTSQEAMGIVNKIKSYVENKDQGIWKNNICFLADDAVSAGITETEHMTYSEEFAKTIAKNYPEYIINKVYCDMYERVTTANGVRYPDAKKAYMDKINSGLLLLNFTGHGSNRDWTHEYIMVNADVELMNNTRYPLMITATCDYGRFDGNITAGSELLVTKSNGGAIGLITASRVVYGSSNKTLNDKILEYILKKEGGKTPRLGDVLRQAKCAISSDLKNNKLKFLLLGDPALRLAIPDDTYDVKIATVNGEDAGSAGIQFKALGATLLEGEIVDSDGNIAENFTGTLETVIFDSEQELKTRGNSSDGTGVAANIKPYTDFTNIIYTGKVEVTNGKFAIHFTTPKDILYLDKPGKISFFAHDPTNSWQAQGVFNNYIVGGTDEDAEEEADPPVIEDIYLNRSGFKSGDQVNTTPFFYAKVSDKSGINLSSAIGHNISLLIDGYKSYNLTSYFANDGASTQSGTVQFSIPELETGDHTLQFKIWDVWNNSATEYLDFKVVEDYKPAVYKFTLEGNPAKDFVNLKLSTDLSGSKMSVKFEVFSMTGAIQWSTEMQGTAGMDTSFEYLWDLITSSGGRLHPGMYICRATVNVDGGGESATKSEKLIVIAQ